MELVYVILVAGKAHWRRKLELLDISWPIVELLLQGCLSSALISIRSPQIIQDILPFLKSADYGFNSHLQNSFTETPKLLFD